MKEINKIGCFHFGGNDKSDPVGSLESELIKGEQESLNTSLIVIPEAFNVRGGYWNDLRNLDRSIADSLMRLSIKFKVAFVAGLIEGQEPNHSSAYLIDGMTRKLLSRKMENDGSSNYTPCSQDFDQPTTHRGVCVAASICMDANFNEKQISGRHKTLLQRIKACAATPVVMCIPAHMQSYQSTSIVEALPAAFACVLANSSSSQPSVIRCQSHLTSTERNKNAISIVEL